jgi:hypothetical protein
VLQLKAGTSADENEPIYIYQMKLYMDEEVGLTEVDGGDFYKGMDYRSIEQFDKWISRHYEKFLYRPKSIMVWQVRRHDKEYDDRAFVNKLLNNENHRSYFLIRNGSNLYRIDSDVYVGPTSFSKIGELEKVIEKDKEYGGDGSEVKEFIKQRMYILFALQGLLDRSNIFGTSLRGKLDLIDPSKFNSDKIKLIRDAEKDMYIGDGRPSWEEWKESNRSTIRQGSKCWFNLPNYYNRSNFNHERIINGNAVHSLKWINPPSSGIYIIEDIEGIYYKIKYIPSGDEEVYSEKEGYHPRKKRLTFLALQSELLNLDEITFEEINYYIHNRLYREDYLGILPNLKMIYQSKKEESIKEQPFIDLLADKFDYSDKEGIRKMLNYWKTKNKWKRFLSTDEGKAFRMIGSWITAAKKKEESSWENYLNNPLL